MVNPAIYENGWLTNEAVCDLRKQIVLNSLYYSDYENDYDLDTKEVCMFFDSYLDYLGELMSENGIADKDFFENLDNYDNDDNLLDWYGCYEDNPFTTDHLQENNDDDE